MTTAYDALKTKAVEKNKQMGNYAAAKAAKAPAAEKTLLPAPNVASALDNPTNDPSEEDMEASALDNRTAEEDAPIAEEVRVCCCGDNCINEDEEEGLECDCYLCGQYCHDVCSSIIDQQSTYNKCKLGL